MLSGIPFDGPIGAVRLAFSTEGVWAPHPTFAEGDEAVFELVVAGRALSDSVESEIAIMMVEAGGTEGSFVKYVNGAPKVTEEVLAEGLEAAKSFLRHEVGKTLGMRVVPNLTFTYDEAIDRGDRVDQLLREAKASDARLAAETPAAVEPLSEEPPKSGP